MTGQSVDPIFGQAPQQWTNAQGQLTFEARRFIEVLMNSFSNLRERTGGGNDNINDLMIINQYASSTLIARQSAQRQEIDDLKNRVESIVNPLSRLVDALNRIKCLEQEVVSLKSNNSKLQALIRKIEDVERRFA